MLKIGQTTVLYVDWADELSQLFAKLNVEMFFFFGQKKRLGIKRSVVEWSIAC